MTVNEDEIRKGKRVMDTLTGNVGILVDIQEIHDRYQLDNVSGWQYGIKNLVPFDAKEETIRQQAEEIERLKEDVTMYRNSARVFEEESKREHRARKAAERERNELLGIQELWRDLNPPVYEIYRMLTALRLDNTAMLECLKEIADSKRDMSGVLARVSARKTIAELDRKDTQPLLYFPRQPNGEGGWTIDTKFLLRVEQRIADKELDGPPSMEHIESVLLAVEDTQPQSLNLSVLQLTELCPHGLHVARDCCNKCAEDTQPKRCETCGGKGGAYIVGMHGYHRDPAYGPCPECCEDTQGEGGR